MGLARLSIAALAITLALGLLIVGGTMLWGAWTKDSSSSQAASSPSPSGSASTTPSRSSGNSTPPDHPAGNTVVIQCLAVQCSVFVAGPGPTDVQFNGKLSRDERRIFSATRLTVAVDDASTVNVTINGHQQPRGRRGEPGTYAVPPAR
jgi:hypothetical protein